MKAQDCPKFGPLQGVKVVNLTMAIAGPFACSLLADLGAEVIGVESPRGRDTSRPTNQALQGWGTQMERRNTRSLCMNVKDGAGRAWFFELLKQADILVDGFRGGQMAKWGMTDEALWEVNPKLTIAHISGFGQTGDPAYVSRASFDGIGQAYGCFMEMNGYPDRLPVLAFPQVSDYYAGFMASIGALAGYINAQRTGKGDSVDVAQYEAMLRCEGFYAELPEHGRAACARGFAQHVERRLRHVHLPGRRAHLHAHPGSRRGARGAAAVRPRVRQRAVPRGHAGHLVRKRGGQRAGGSDGGVLRIAHRRGG